MPTGTISTFTCQESTPHTMLTSSASEGLEYLADCGRSSKGVPFSIFELDDIVEGKNLEKYTEEIEESCYLNFVMDSLQWWIEVSKAINYGRENDNDPKDYGAKRIRLLNDALSSYAAAFAESYYHSSGSDCGPAGLELLKRYRLYTICVCEYADERWPDVDLGWLWTRS